MREDRLLDVMNFLDEDMLEEANRVRQYAQAKDNQKKMPLWIKWRKELVAIVALLLVALGITGFMTDEKGELIYGESFKGAAGCGVIYSEEELSFVNSDVPWNRQGAFVTATLPVYKNLSYSLAGEPSGLSDGQMVDLLKKTAGALKLDVKQIEKIVNDKNPELVYCYYTEVDNTRIEVEADGLITIMFKDAIEVEEDYSEAYKDLLDFEEPIATSNEEGNYVVFDGSGNLVEDMISYFFAYGEFYTNEEGNLSIIRIHNELMAAEKMGDYFYISEDEAKEKLFRGEFYTNSGYGIYENSPTIKTELVYINSRGQKYFMPYYCFYVEIEDDDFDAKPNYGTFYVPAVDLETSPKLEQ